MVLLNIIFSILSFFELSKIINIILFSGLSACRAAALSTTMLTRRKSSIDGTKTERNRRRGESIGGAFTDMINIEPTSIINKSTGLYFESEKCSGIRGEVVSK